MLHLPISMGKIPITWNIETAQTNTHVPIKSPIKRWRSMTYDIVIIICMQELKNRRDSGQNTYDWHCVVEQISIIN